MALLLRTVTHDNHFVEHRGVLFHGDYEVCTVDFHLFLLEANIVEHKRGAHGALTVKRPSISLTTACFCFFNTDGSAYQRFSCSSSTSPVTVCAVPATWPEARVRPLRQVPLKQRHGPLFP